MIGRRSSTCPLGAWRAPRRRAAVGAIPVACVVAVLVLQVSTVFAGAGASQPASVPAHQASVPPPEEVPHQRTWSIMGTILQVTVYRSDRELAQQDLRAAYEQIVDVDERMSLYRDESELSLLNARAGTGPVAVSGELMEVIATAAEFHAISGGAFDITVTPLVDLWGFYDFSGSSVPPPELVEQRLLSVGMNRVIVDAEARTIDLPDGASLDLGGVAKGYAVDLAMEVLEQRGTPAAMVDLGGNIAVFGEPTDAAGWWIGIRHPRREGGLIASVRLESGQAVATSGDYERFFETGGDRYSHILDPRTGMPVRGVVAVTVVAGRAVVADALSTAAFVLGAEAGLELLRDYPAVDGVVVTPNATNDRSPPSETLKISTTPGLSSRLNWSVRVPDESTRK